jgi:GNAT superfamily N-acetyltransferase
MILIRALDPNLDEALLLYLWTNAFGAQWPMDLAWLRSVSMGSSYLHGDHLIAEVEGQAAGFVLTQVGKGDAPGGSILAIGVLPEHRRSGVGRALHGAALERLRERGVEQVHLGSGAAEYFWPGVPVGLPGAWEFFQAMGWPEIERSFDLIRSLEDYTTPDWVWERVACLGIKFGSAEGLPPEEVVAFVEAEEPGWKDLFSRFLSNGRARDVLLAHPSAGGEIAGACLLESDDRRWAACFPRPLGAPGCFLVARKWRERGLGMALVARANEILQARGCKTCFIGWTWLVDWYGQLGFEVWQENVMSWRRIEE